MNIQDAELERTILKLVEHLGEEKAAPSIEALRRMHARAERWKPSMTLSSRENDNGDSGVLKPSR